MNKPGFCKRLGVGALCALTFSASLQSTVAEAAVVDTQTAIELGTRAANLARVDRALSAAGVKSRLLALGVDRAAVDERLAGLTDGELAAFADRLDSAPAGGDGLAVIGLLFVVLLILELVGVIDIFKNIGSARR